MGKKLSDYKEKPEPVINGSDDESDEYGGEKDDEEEDEYGEDKDDEEEDDKPEKEDGKYEILVNLVNVIIIEID